MQELLFFRDGKICLNTTQNPDFFSKSRYAQRLSEAGTKAVYQNGSWNFSPWHFTSSLQLPEVCGDAVCLTGEGRNGKSLHEILFSDDKNLIMEENAIAKKHYAVARTCSLLEEAVAKGEKIIINGTGGIFVSDDFCEFIFLPRTIYENSVDCLSGEESCELDGVSINPFLFGIPALRFFEADLIYTSLTGEHAYGNKHPSDHRDDLLDTNFIPLKNKVWALDEKLSSWCDSSLSQSLAKPAELPPLPFPSLYRELGLTEDGTLTAGNGLLPVIRKSSVSQETFSAKVKAENDRRKKQLSTKRWFRKYQTTLLAGAAAFVLVCSIVLMYTNSQMRKRTSKSLTSTETIEMFYSSLNLLDVDSVQNSSKGREARGIANVVSNAYVSTKARSLVTMNDITVTPASWLSENNGGLFNMFGLTQFTVDGIKRNIFRQGPVRNTHPKKLTEQDGEKLTDGMTEKHQADYYLVYTDGEGKIKIISHQDVVTVTYVKNKWLVTGLVQWEGESEASFKDFIADYKEAMEETEGNVTHAAEILRSKYRWLSTNSEIFDSISFETNASS